jgi:hypothetical protein
MIAALLLFLGFFLWGMLSPDSLTGFLYWCFTLGGVLVFGGILSYVVSTLLG